MFTNVVPGSTEVVRPWVEALRNVGFAVFAKPKVTDDSDVDDDMLAHIALRAARGRALARRRRVRRRAGVPRSRSRTLVAQGRLRHGHRVPRVRQLRADLRGHRVRRPRGHRRRVPRAAAADDAGDPARHRCVAAAVPFAAVAARAAAVRWGPRGSPLRWCCRATPPVRCCATAPSTSRTGGSRGSGRSPRRRRSPGPVRALPGAAAARPGQHPLPHADAAAARAWAATCRCCAGCTR